MPRRKSKTRKGRPIDRYPRGAALWVSEIAEQAYCEQRVELWLKNPGRRVSVPKEMERTEGAAEQETMAVAGLEVHQDLAAGGRAVTPRELRRQLNAGARLTVMEMSLLHKYEGIPIIGRADGVCFDGTKASCVIDYKYSKSSRLHDDWRLQLLLYGYLLSKEFGVEDLLLVCALLPLSIGKEPIREGFASAICRFARSGAPGTASNGGILFRSPSEALTARLHVFRYDHNAVIRDLGKYMEYWLGERRPSPAGNPKRCVECRYNARHLCPVPQAQFGTGPSPA